MSTSTAPPGRVYNISGAKPKELEDYLNYFRLLYTRSCGSEPTWLRCHPSQFEQFQTIWPGAVVAEDAQLKGTIRLGRD